MGSNSYLNKTGFFSEYDELNSIIANIFFNENSNNKPIYMDWADVQDDTVRKASNNKFNTKSQLLVSLGIVVKKTLYKRSNPTFKEHEIRVRFWQEEIDYISGGWQREEFAYKSTFSEPPIIAVLSLFSYAAETMIGDEENDIGTTNYYVRLLEKLNINVESEQKKLMSLLL